MFGVKTENNLTSYSVVIIDDEVVVPDHLQADRLHWLRRRIRELCTTANNDMKRKTLAARRAVGDYKPSPMLCQFLPLCLPDGSTTKK